MNTIMMKTILCLSMTALLITTAFAGPASAQEGLPFSGSIEGTEDFTPIDDESGIDLAIHGSGGGSASHLGPFTATWDGDITFANPDNPIKRTFVAANGDELYAEGPGAGTPPDPDQFVVENMTITGGTGWFLGASGSFTVERTVYNVAPPFTDLETSGSFDGFIILQGVPFSGVIEGTEDFTPIDDGSGVDLHIVGSGAGNASHLGPFTATWDGDITFANPDNPIERTFVAANGDELYAEGPGAGTPPDPDQFVVENMTITGGTGRFAGARGSFTVERTVYNVAPPFMDLETSGSFGGFIILQGIPFSGVIEGTEAFTPIDDGSGVDLHIVGSGAGNASQLGPFTATWDGDITFANPDQPIERTFVAANGDELYAEGLGAGTPPDPDQFVVENMTITGGTGRFAGARGSFTVERRVFNVAPPFTDLETRGSFSGTILLSLPTTFLRGDCNDDGKADIADVTCALDWLFTGGSEPGCLAAANTNADDKVDIADPVSLLCFLFAGGPAPASPFPDCGPGELQADAGLGCAIPSDCQQ